MCNHRFIQFSHGPSWCIPYHEKMRRGIRAILQKVSRYQQSVALVNVYKTPGEALTHSVYLYIFIFGRIRASHQSWCAIFLPYTESSGDAKRRGPEKQSKHVIRTWRWEGRSQKKKNHFPLADLYSRITERWLELSWELSILTKLRKHST